MLCYIHEKVTIQSPKPNLPKIKESKASKAVVPALEAVDVSDFKIRKSLAPCNERNVPSESQTYGIIEAESRINEVLR